MYGVGDVLPGPAPPPCRLRCKDPKGPKPRRSTRRAAHPVRVGDQPQGRQGARTDDPADAVAARGSGDRVTRAGPRGLRPRKLRTPGGSRVTLARVVRDYGAPGGAQEPPIVLGARRRRGTEDDVLREGTGDSPLRPAAPLGVPA